jgi:branched-chain amino acid transport system permease protein
VDYVLYIMFLVGIYVTLAVSLGFSAGQAGLLSIAHAALFGVGAYTTAITAVSGSMPVASGVVLGAAMAVLVSIPLGVAATRLRGDRFVLAALAYQALATSVFENWIGLTGGPLGIGGVPHGFIPQSGSFTKIEFVCLASVLAGFAIISTRRLSAGPYGWLLHSIRDDEVVALSLGKKVRRTKFQVLAISAALAGAAGGLYASYATFVDPYSFTLNESIAIAAMAIIGGLRTSWGPVLGAVALVLLPEALRFSGLPHAIAASLNQAIFGSALVWIVMFRPQGLLGKRSELTPESGGLSGGRR